MPEARFKAALLRRLNRLPSSFFVASNPGAASGLPDITGVLNGRYLSIETKVPGKTSEPHQRVVHKKILLAGGMVYQIRSWQEWKDVAPEIIRSCGLGSG